MGDEDKVKHEQYEIMRSGSTFLPDEIRDIDGEAEVYSLDKEFAKTKKNKNYKLYLYIAGFIFLIVFLAWGYTYVLTERASHVKVNIQEFEDLRLKEVLQSARKSENNVELLRIQLQTLRVKMLNAVLEVRREYLGKELDILAQNLPQDNTDATIADLRKQELRSIRIVKARYANRIGRKRRQIWSMEADMRKEQEIIAEKRKAGHMANEDRLNTLKMKNLRKVQQSGIESMKNYNDNYSRYLIIKYNPVFRSPEMSALVSSTSKSPDPGSVVLKDYQAVLASGAGISQEKFAVHRKNIENDLRVIKRISNIPYINSVAPAVKTIEVLTKTIVNEYESIWYSLAQSLNIKNTKLAGHKFALGQLMKRWPEGSGVVLDGRNNKSIRVYMKNEILISAGDSAKVVRDENQEYIATIRFFKESGILKARVVRQEEDLEPFDKILLLNVNWGN